jgi:hypothetical protein
MAIFQLELYWRWKNPFQVEKKLYIDEITRYQRNSNDIPTFSAMANSEEPIPALQHVT